MTQLEKWERFYEDKNTIRNMLFVNVAYPDVMGVLLNLTDEKSKCIELGCGSGTYVVEMIANKRNCIGFDQSKAGLELTKLKGKKLYNVEVPTKVGDIYSMPFKDNKFDLVFSDGVLEHLDVSKALQEISRITKPGGYVITKVPAKNLSYKIIYRLMELFTFHADETLRSKKGWKSLFEQAGFRNVAVKMCGPTNVAFVRRVLRTKKLDNIIPNFFKIYYLIEARKL